MKKSVSLLLVLAFMFTRCFAESGSASEISFKGLGDPQLLSYIEDTIYSDLVSQLDDEYYIEKVEALYIPDEYFEELEFNSQVNVYFGYTLAELEEQFQGEKYVFTLGGNNETVVVPFEASTDSGHVLSTILKNVAIGTGVILICVTVAVLTKNPAAAVGAGKAIKTVYAVSVSAAKSSAIRALEFSGIGGISAALIEGYQSHDFSRALRTGVVAASEGFKIGAIEGASESIFSRLQHNGNTTYFKPGTPQALKYPEGVQFTETPNGLFPRFEKWAKATVKFDTPTLETALNHTGLSGNYYWDAKLANQLCDFPSTPQGYVWHHVEDMVTMILVPQDLHSVAMGGMSHTGGASLIRSFLGL